MLERLGWATVNAQNADREFAIAYKRQYNTITGSVEGSLLLQQISFWWGKMGRKPFYKFRAPCKATQYKPGDSWLEELGFTAYQFDSAIQRIATKITQGTSREEVFPNVLVVYWTTEERLTYYEVNENNFHRMAAIVYHYPDLIEEFGYDPKMLGTPEFRNYLSNCEIWLENTERGYSNQKSNLHSNSEIPNYMISENTIDHKETEKTEQKEPSLSPFNDYSANQATTEPRTLEERAADMAWDNAYTDEPFGDDFDVTTPAPEEPPFDVESLEEPQPDDPSPAVKFGHPDYIADPDERIAYTHCPACGHEFGPEEHPLGESSPLWFCNTCGWVQKFKPKPPEPSVAQLMTAEGLAGLQAQSVQIRQQQAQDDWRSYRPGWYKPRQGVTAEELQRVDWALFSKTGLSCLSDDKQRAVFWQNGLANMWAESGRDMDVIIRAIEKAWKEHESSNPTGYVNTCAKLRAMKARPPQQPGSEWA